MKATKGKRGSVVIELTKTEAQHLRTVTGYAGTVTSRLVDVGVVSSRQQEALHRTLVRLWGHFDRLGVKYTGR